ncbi:MFS transporter [Streptomyces sp. NPDC048106]|uniref:MFS transporter n=1 Tax=Streptomyces sp. NPDC048106 TaxID=3155750 RepID=UPI003456F26C
MTNRLPLLTLVGVSAISSLGLAVTVLALPWFVLQSSGSGADTAAVAVAETLGLLLSAVFGGPLVDRLPARAASVGADASTAVAIGLIPLAHLTVGLTLPLLLLLALLAGLTRGPADTAKQLLLADVLRRVGTPVERGTGAIEAARRLGTMAGAPLAGLLMAATGPVPVLAADASALLLSAVLVGLLVPAHRPAVSGGPASDGYLASLAAGFRGLRRDRLVRAMVGMLLLTNAMDGGLNSVLYPAYGQRVLHSSALLGTLLTTAGAGALAGSALYGRIGHRLPRRAVFVLAFTLVGPPRFLLLAWAPPPAVLLPALAVCGLGSGVLMPLMTTVAYQRVPERLRGRVFGLVVAGALAALPVGTLAAGLLLDRIGLTGVLAAFGCCYLVVMLFPLLFPVWRELDAGSPTADVVDPQGPESTVPAHGR